MTELPTSATSPVRSVRRTDLGAGPRQPGDEAGIRVLVPVARPDAHEHRAR
ncbi:hypothetical protein [Pseudonocardia adelaidensis]|uniref:hypothetical protein n=1 Tax=Pseudonocardia adelaidensis TaxID=648754 RepID=UPI0031E7E511